MDQKEIIWFEVKETALDQNYLKSNKYSSLQAVTYPEIFWEYCFQQGISGQEPKRTYSWTLKNNFQL